MFEFMVLNNNHALCNTDPTPKVHSTIPNRMYPTEKNKHLINNLSISWIKELYNIQALVAGLVAMSQHHIVRSMIFGAYIESARSF